MPHVLLIDDDASIRKLVEQLLAQEGYRVTAVARVEDALAVAAQDSPDFALIDVVGVATDGLISDLRALCPGLPISLFTALSAERLDPIMGTLPADVDIVHKPFDVDEFVTHIALKVPVADR